MLDETGIAAQTVWNQRGRHRHTNLDVVGLLHLGDEVALHNAQFPAPHHDNVGIGLQRQVVRPTTLAGLADGDCGDFRAATLDEGP